MQEKTTPARPDWFNLFDSILQEPGILGDHYRAFHEYSLGNQMLAVMQLVQRGLPISPIASFNAWKQKGRCVSKGQKAIALWMPVTIKSSTKGERREAEEADSAEPGPARRVFVMRNNWFAFSQTEPDERGDCPSYSEPATPAIDWDKAQALSALGIEEVPFSMLNGNIQGVAWPSQKRLAVSPLAAFPQKTLFHELAHCLLHAKDGGEFSCAADLSVSLKEAEAESTAFLCCAALGLPGLECSRGYVQSWLQSGQEREAFKKSAGRVFSAANTILKAGALERESTAQKSDSDTSMTAHAERESEALGQGLLFA